MSSSAEAGTKRHSVASPSDIQQPGDVGFAQTRQRTASAQSSAASAASRSQQNECAVFAWLADSAALNEGSMALMRFENLNTQAESGTTGGRDRVTVSIVASDGCRAWIHQASPGLLASIRRGSSAVQSSQPGFRNSRGGLKLLSRNSTSLRTLCVVLRSTMTNDFGAVRRALARRFFFHFSSSKGNGPLR